MAKSGEVIAILLTKLFGDIVYDSPPMAIKAMPLGKPAVFEDGLWSGTEAMGVVESLLREQEGREKTAPLEDVCGKKHCMPSHGPTGICSASTSKDVVGFSSTISASARICLHPNLSSRGLPPPPQQL